MMYRQRALMAYFGSKRRIVKHIFQHLPKPARDKPLVFMDAFMGGGSVSIYAKSMGYKVIAGDITLRSEIIGQALIENNDKKIPDISKIFQPNNYGDFIFKNYGDYFFKETAVTLDWLRESILDRGSKPIEVYLLMKLLSYYMPYGMMIRKVPKPPEGYKNRQDQENAWLRELAKHKVYAMQVKEMSNPYAMVRKIISQINTGVFNNGQTNEFHRVPAIKLIKSCKADIVYMDPPYPGTLSYDESEWLDKIIKGDTKYHEDSGSEWTNKKTFLQTFEDHIKASKHVPNLVMSIGNWDANELLKVTKNYRPGAAIYSIKHNWLRALKKKEKGDELMIVDIEKGF